MDSLSYPPHDPKIDAHDAAPRICDRARAHALPICHAPLHGAGALGTLFVQQHSDGSLTVEGAWHATVRRCIPAGYLTISLSEVTAWYWCLESDFIAAGFSVPEAEIEAHLARRHE